MDTVNGVKREQNLGKGYVDTVNGVERRESGAMLCGHGKRSRENKVSGNVMWTR